MRVGIFIHLFLAAILLGNLFWCETFRDGLINLSLSSLLLFTASIGILIRNRLKVQ